MSPDEFTRLQVGDELFHPDTAERVRVIYSGPHNGTVAVLDLDTESRDTLTVDECGEYEHAED